MCVVVYKKPESEFSDENVDKCWARNADGAGFVFIPKDGEIVMEKGIMDLKTFKEKTVDFRKVGGKLVCHFRVQSRGGKTPDLTHPFDFSTEKQKRFLFHNGTVRCFDTKYGTSDSKMIAGILKPLSNKDGLNLLKRWRDKIENAEFPTKFVAIYGREVEILPNKDSVEKYGLWFSNLKHEEHKGPPAVVGDGGDNDYAEFWSTGYCGRHPIQSQNNGYNPTDHYFKRSMTPPASKPEIGKTISVKDRDETANQSAWKVALANSVPDSEIAEYCKQILIDYDFTNWPDSEMIKLKSFVDDVNDENPLLSYVLSLEKAN